MARTPVFLTVLVCLAAVYLVAMAGCAPQPQSLFTPTETPMPTPTLEEPTVTPTVVWFPPTPTYTPYPTAVITPTAEMRTGIGEVILKDDFATADDWQLSSAAAGSVALSKNELTIAISEPKNFLFSVRQQPVLADFYLEINASPNLCREMDEYGLLVRVSATTDYYRFALSCDGQVRLDRVVNGEASSPQPWTYSGAVPPGAPSTSRLGVWASGSEMRFFVNGEYQFTVRDPVLPSGLIGVFARSVSNSVLTVNFSNLEVRALSKGER